MTSPSQLVFPKATYRSVRGVIPDRVFTVTEVRPNESSPSASIICYTDGQTGTWMMDQRSFLEEFVLLKPYEPEPPFKVTAGTLYRHTKSGLLGSLWSLNGYRALFEVMLVEGDVRLRRVSVDRELQANFESGVDEFRDQTLNLLYPPASIVIFTHLSFLQSFTPVQFKLQRPEDPKPKPPSSGRPEWLIRIDVEAGELSVKMQKLTTFLCEVHLLPEGRKPTASQELLMRLQLDAMRLYYQILLNRLKDGEDAMADAQVVHHIGNA